MDIWDFKKWRKMLRLTQVDAARELGVSRAAVQHWESERTPIPRTVELACHELTRRWKRHPEFGPVILVYTDGPIWQPSDGPYRVALLQCELYANNEAATQHACRRRNDPSFVNPFIMGEDGEVIWAGAELVRECDKHRSGSDLRTEATALRRVTAEPIPGRPTCRWVRFVKQEIR
jgi:transcriptional regulator with XRE-family HTH domain